MLVIVAGVVIAWLAHAQVARGQQSDTPSIQPAALPGGPTVATASPTRLVKLYDFEDRDDSGLKIGMSLSNAPDWYPIGRDPQESDPSFQRQPLHQQLQARRHYPAFNEVRMDDKAAHSGQYALHLQLRGGNTGAFVEVGAVPAVPGSDYRVSAAVRTDVLKRAGAQVSAYFIDARGKAMAHTIASVGPLQTDGRWQSFSLMLPGDYPDVAWIGIEVEVLQPTVNPESPLGDEQVVLPDIRGGAWFDDIAVWQVPSVRIATQSPVNIIRAPEQPQVSVSVRDLSGQRLVAEATIYDAGMNPVLRETRRVGAGSPGNWLWEPKLPAFGWYRIDLATVETEGPAAGQVIARAGGALLYLPGKEALAPADRARFTLIAEDANANELRLIDNLLIATNLYAVTLSAFNPQTTLADFEHQQAQINNAVEKLLMSGRHITLTLDPVPIELAQALGLDTADAMAAINKEPDQWETYLTPVVMRHGQRVRRWQVGSSLQADAYFQPHLLAASRKLTAMFYNLAPDPVLVLPWSLDQARRLGDLDQYEYATYVPVGITPRDLGQYLDDWQTPPAQVALELATPSALKVPQDQRVRDLTLRMLYAWEQEPAAMGLRRPWTPAGSRRDTLVPDPLLGVLANVSHHLAGRRVVGRLKVVPGVECMILDGNRGGMLALWNEQADEDAEIAMMLGNDPVAVDVWGNRVPLPKSDGIHRMTVPRTPVFIEGIDARLALFRSAFTLTPALIESRQGKHERTITLSNPFDSTISGRLIITGPEDWQSSPSTHFFSIASGKTIELPITFSFPINEVAGYKELTARVQFRADQPYDIELSSPMMLGLPGIDYSATMALVDGDKPGTTDAVVTAIVTNTGDTVVSLYAFASLAGHPRTEHPIPTLEPGESAVRSFRFHEVSHDLSGHAIRAGIRENNGPAILNYRLTPGN